MYVATLAGASAGAFGLLLGLTLLAVRYKKRGSDTQLTAATHQPHSAWLSVVGHGSDGQFAADNVGFRHPALGGV